MTKKFVPVVPGEHYGLRLTMEWLRENIQQYRGNWVAIKDGELLGSALTREELPDVDTRDVLITRIPELEPPPTVDWNLIV